MHISMEVLPIAFGESLDHVYVMYVACLVYMLAFPNRSLPGCPAPHFL